MGRIMSKWRSSPAMPARVMSTVSGSQCCPRLDQIGDRCRVGIGEPRIIDQPGAADMAGIRDRQRRLADRQSQSLRPFTVAPLSVSGTDGHSMECRSSSTSTLSINLPHGPGAGQLAGVDVDPSSTAGSHSRFMSSSRKRVAVGWAGSNLSKAARLAKPKVSRATPGLQAEAQQPVQHDGAGDLVAMDQADHRHMRAGLRRRTMLMKPSIPVFA